MRYLFFILLVALSIPGFARFHENGIQVQYEVQDSTAKTGHELVPASKFKELIDKDSTAQIIDVRTPGEYDKGFIEGATNVNVNDRNFLTNSLKFDTSKTIYVYCLSGGRSRAASRKLMKAGFKHVVELSGGILSWNGQKYPIVVKEQVGVGMTMSDFKKKLVSDKKVLVVFSATWCGPCIRMKPMINKVGNEHSDSLEVLRIDVDENPTLTTQLNIESIPFLVLFDGGKQKWYHVGAMTEKELLDKIKE